jgi:hypothetical protein
MKNPDEVPEGALFDIARRNIRICGFHSNKRVVSTLLDLLYRDWSNMEKRKDEKKEDFEARKADIAIRWQLYAGRTFGFGDQYVIQLTKDEIPKPVKLDGSNARKIMENWREGLKIMDGRQETEALWKVGYFISRMSEIIRLSLNKKLWMIRIDLQQMN